MDAITNIKRKMNETGTTIYQLSKETGIKYELLRRSLCKKRKLSADEYVSILNALERNEPKEGGAQ